MKKAILFFLLVQLFCFINITYSQTVLPLNRDYTQQIEKSLIKKNISFHDSFKPFMGEDIQALINYDSLTNFSNRDSVFINHFRHPWFWKKLRRENFLVIKTPDFSATIDPLFDIQIGQDVNAKTNHFVNTRGVEAKGKIGKDFFFQTNFYENQATFVDYINAFVDTFGVVPGQGKAKKFKNNGYDYSMASGLISYSPNRHFNFQLGHGKHFIGDGYRSLLLSDNSFNYPFFEFSTSFWKIQYTTLYAVFQDMNSTIMQVQAYQKKYATIHYLSYNISNFINLGLFESTIWQARADGKNINYQWYYLNPLIAAQTITTSLNGIDNTMLGANMRVKFLKHFSIYSQFVFDDWDFGKSNFSNGYLRNKFGYQTGLKYFDVLSLKNLYFQYEYNHVRPYTYSHYNPLQSYTNYNQPLAHPLGANFSESVCILKYRIKDFFFEIKLNYAIYGADTGIANYGKNLFASNHTANNGLDSYNNEFIQGVKTTLLIEDFRMQYLINPKTNMNIVLGVSDRNENSILENQHSCFFYFGIRTSLSNFYCDF